MPTINSGVKRFENGGILTLTVSATAQIMANVMPGTLKVSEGFAKRLEYTDRGVQQTPIPGDEELCVAEFELRLGKLQGSNELMTLARASGTNGAIKTYDSLEIKFLDGPSAATGEKITMANCWFDSVPKVETGEFDRITGIMIKCKKADYTPASF